MKSFTSSLLVLLFASLSHGQGVTAGFFNQYHVNQPASASIGQSSPLPVLTLTDTEHSMNLQTFNTSAPVVMLFDTAPNLGSTIAINAWNMYNIQLDLRDRGNNGYVVDQVLFSGYTNPNPQTWTDNSGALTACATLPSCRLLDCITQANFDQFEVSSQAIVFNPTNAPFNLSSTPAIQGTMDNGYTEFSLSGNSSAQYTFKQGFTFQFYGNTYSQCWVSENGFISFGATPDTGFPNPTTNGVAIGVPRIMSYYTDLDSTFTTFDPSTRIYVQQFRDKSGLMKAKFVHDWLPEFFNMTGAHGGEITITDDDDIAVYVFGYNGASSINVAVGITPGSSIDPNIPGFGQDLTARSGTGHVRGPGKSAFELFDQGNLPVQNTLDLAGFGINPQHPVGSGVVFLKNPAAANTMPTNSSYIIQ